MGSLSSAKTLGGVGGILVFLPFVSLVGWILILLATKEISETVQDKSIFDDALLAAITAIIGAVVFVAFIVTGSITGLFTFGLGFPRFLLFFGILGAFWVFAVISAIFLKRSYEKISQRLNVSAFANHRSTLPYWCGPHDRIRRLPDSPSCLDLPSCRVLLHSRSATLARLGTACPTDLFVGSSTTAASNVPAATSGRVKILFQMWSQASKCRGFLHQLRCKTGVA